MWFSRRELKTFRDLGDLMASRFFFNPPVCQKFWQKKSTSDHFEIKQLYTVNNSYCILCTCFAGGENW